MEKTEKVKQCQHFKLQSKLWKSLKYAWKIKNKKTIKIERT